MVSFFELQQAEVFRVHTALRIMDIWGEMGVDAWGPPEWQLAFQNDLLVCTPMILLNLLRRAYIKVGTPT